MNLLSGVESKSFRTFTLFTFVVLITLALLVSIFSNKYRVSTINYDYELNQIFFDDLEIRMPDYFLHAAGSNSIETIGNTLILSLIHI